MWSVWLRFANKENQEEVCTRSENVVKAKLKTIIPLYSVETLEKVGELTYGQLHDKYDLKEGFAYNHNNGKRL